MPYLALTPCPHVAKYRAWHALPTATVFSNVKKVAPRDTMCLCIRYIDRYGGRHGGSWTSKHTIWNGKPQFSTQSST